MKGLLKFPSDMTSSGGSAATPTSESPSTSSKASPARRGSCFSTAESKGAAAIIQRAQRSRSSNIGLCSRKSKGNLIEDVTKDPKQSALLQACIKGDTKEALKLIDDPMVSIDTTDKVGRTPLIHAITHKHTGALSTPHTGAHPWREPPRPHPVRCAPQLSRCCC